MWLEYNEHYLRFFRTADSYRLQVFGMDKFEKRLFNELDEETLLLMKTSDDLDELWRLRCTTCLHAESVSVYREQPEYRIEQWRNVSFNTLDYLHSLDVVDLDAMGYNEI